jgi:hypothetical protein
MDAQGLRNLQEAYREIYAEAIDDEGRYYRDKPRTSASLTASLTAAEREARRKRLAAAAGSITTPYRDSAAADAELKRTNPEEAKRREVEARQRRMRLAGTLLSQPKEQVDIYDIILSHLLDEGYAETPEAAEKIMVNMSEEWREDIVEAAVDYEMSSDEMEKARNERKFGKQGFNQAGQTALRRGLHKSQRGMKKKDVRRWEGDK